MSFVNLFKYVFLVCKPLENSADILFIEDNFNSIIISTSTQFIYSITAVMKVEKDIIASITASTTGWAVIMYVWTFKTDVIVFISYES